MFRKRVTVPLEARFAEAVFVQAATQPDADVSIRIFTPETELPFAGHPTLGTAFVLVTSPRRDAVEEATFFAERLAEDGRRIETLIVNRVHPAFGGADPAYFTRNSKGVIEAAAADYAGPTAEARRARIMPFVWQTVARDGQIFGDAARQSRVHLTNGLWFSYPGYNELLSGAADPRIDSNDKVPNPNVTVLEWLNTRPGVAGRVEAFVRAERAPRDGRPGPASRDRGRYAVVRRSGASARRWRAAQ